MLQQRSLRNRWKRPHPSRAIVAAALLVGLAGGAAAPAWATCGATNCFLVTGTQEGVGLPGTVTVDISYRYVVMSRKMAGTHEVVTSAVVTREHSNWRVASLHNTLVTLTR